MGGHWLVVQSYFTNERLLPFLFTPGTYYFHDDLGLSKVNAEYPSGENRQIQAKKPADTVTSTALQENRYIEKIGSTDNIELSRESGQKRNGYKSDLNERLSLQVATYSLVTLGVSVSLPKFSTRRKHSNGV